MSNAKKPQHEWPPNEAQGQDEMERSLMGRAQEMEHVQGRVSHAAWSNPEGALATSPGGEPAQKAREKLETFLPTTEGGAWRVASALRFGAAGFGLMASVLFVLPELTGSFQPPSVEELKQPTYTTIAPTFDEPQPSENLDEVITEQTSSFDGAAILVVDSEPGGVSVEVDGSDQGETPVSLTLDCMPGKPIKVAVTRRGYERAQHTTFCRANTMIKLFAKMRKPEKKPGTSGKK